jgi:hypothetical protein
VPSCEKRKASNQEIIRIPLSKTARSPGNIHFSQQDTLPRQFINGSYQHNDHSPKTARNHYIQLTVQGDTIDDSKILDEIQCPEKHVYRGNLLNPSMACPSGRTLKWDTSDGMELLLCLRDNAIREAQEWAWKKSIVKDAEIYEYEWMLAEQRARRSPKPDQAWFRIVKPDLGWKINIHWGHRNQGLATSTPLNEMSHQALVAMWHDYYAGALPNDFGLKVELTLARDTREDGRDVEGLRVPREDHHDSGNSSAPKHDQNAQDADKGAEAVVKMQVD